MRWLGTYLGLAIYLFSLFACGSAASTMPDNTSETAFGPPISILDDVVSRIDSQALLLPFFPAAPSWLELYTTTTCPSSHLQPANDIDLQDVPNTEIIHTTIYQYTDLPVDEQIHTMQQLRKIELSPLYWQVSTNEPYLFKYHYVRRISSRTSIIEAHYDLPFTSDKLNSVWVECTLITDRWGAPLSRDRWVTRPIALLVGSKLFLVQERDMAYLIDTRQAGGRESEMRTASCLEFVWCRDLSTVKEKAISLVWKYTDSAMSDQLGASPIDNPDLPSTMREYRRVAKKSAVLRGFEGPYYEETTYLVTLLIDRQNSILIADTIELHPKLHIKIDYSYLLSSNGVNGKYEDYSKYWIEQAYADAVRAVIDRIFVSTIEELKQETADECCIKYRRHEE
jgi:hypothetical protein